HQGATLSSCPTWWKRIRISSRRVTLEPPWKTFWLLSRRSTSLASRQYSSPTQTRLADVGAELGPAAAAGRRATRMYLACTTKPGEVSQPGSSCSWTTLSRAHPHGCCGSVWSERSCLAQCCFTKWATIFTHASALSIERRRTWRTIGREPSGEHMYGAAM